MMMMMMIFMGLFDESQRLAYVALEVRMSDELEMILKVSIVI
jgi:hypothetical protein